MVQKFKSAYNRPKNPGITFRSHERIRTQQQFKDECDINNIMKRYKDTQLFPDSARDPAEMHFGDFTNIPDLLTAHELCVEAFDAFENMPSKIRERFKNDPFELIDFAQNPDNYDEAVRLGIIEKKPAAQVIATEVAAPPKSPAPGATPEKSETPPADGVTPKNP